jgi:hypothetical protein
MDSQQPQLTSTGDSQPSTTDDMAGTINNNIHSGATQHFYHSCHVTNVAPAAAVPTGLPNDSSSQPAEEEGHAEIEYDDYQCVYLPQAMFATFSEKKATTMMEVVVKRRKINRARPSLKWLKSSFAITNYWTENNTRRAPVQWIKGWNLFINSLVCYYQL